MKYERDSLNELALADPKPGDYWQEMFCPYFLVVNVNGSAITVLSCMGGPDSYNRMHEPNARISIDNDNWGFDYSKSMIVDLAWMRKAVKYDSIDGFVADVVRSDKTRAVAEEWIKFRTDRLMQEIRDLGPTASKYLLEAQ